MLDLVPREARRIIEIGCSSGALAREYRERFPRADYLGVEIHAEYAALAGGHCDRTLHADIETVEDDFWRANADRDCWIFADVLVHLCDPWQVLRSM